MYVIEGGRSQKIEDAFTNILDYKGSDGEEVMLKCVSRAWYWRHVGGRWHGPFTDYDSGKHHALLDAAHAFKKSGEAMNWQPNTRSSK